MIYFSEMLDHVEGGKRARRNDWPIGRYIKMEKGRIVFVKVKPEGNFVEPFKMSLPDFSRWWDVI